MRRWTSLAAFMLILLFAAAADWLMDALGPGLFLAVSTVVMGTAWALNEKAVCPDRMKTIGGPWEGAPPP